MKNKGIMFIALSALCFAFMNMFVRLSGDLPSIQKSFFRNFIALITASVIVVKNRKEISVEKGSVKYLLLRAFFGTVGLLCNFYAVDHLALADASMLNKMSPFFAVAASCFILKENITPTQFFIVLGAFIGSMFVVKPSFSNAELFPSLLGLCGGIGAGIAYTYVRKLGNIGVNGSFIVFFFSAFSCIVTLPFFIFDFHPMTMTQTIMLLLAGLSAAGGQFSITAAYCCAPAREISVYDYSQIIFAAVLGYLVFGQLPDGWSFLGYGIIIAMAVIMFLYNNKRIKKLN